MSSRPQTQTVRARRALGGQIGPSTQTATQLAPLSAPHIFVKNKKGQQIDAIPSRKNDALSVKTSVFYNGDK